MGDPLEVAGSADDARVLREHFKSLMDDVRQFLDDSGLLAALVDSDEAGIAIAETNASGFVVDDVEPTGISYNSAASVLVTFNWWARGSQDEDHVFCGDEIKGTATLIVRQDYTTELRDITAERSDYVEADGPDEPADL